MELIHFYSLHEWEIPTNFFPTVICIQVKRLIKQEKK